MQLRWKQTKTLLSKYLGPLKKQAALLGLLLLAGIGMQLLIPQILRAFIDAAKAKSGLEIMIRCAWQYILIGLAGQLISTCVTYLSADIGWKATNRLRNDLTLHCLKLDMPFHQVRTPGEMIERVDGDVNALVNFFSQFLVSVLGNFILLIGVLTLVLHENRWIGLALIGFTVVAMTVLILVRNMAIPVFKKEREKAAAQMGFIEERLGGLEDIRANGMGAHALRGFSNVAGELFHASRRSGLARNIVWLITMTLFLLGNLMALTLGAHLYLRGAITLGTVYLLFQYTAMLRMPLEELTRQLQDLQQAGASMIRIGELLDVTPTIVDGPDAPLPDGPLSVEFDHVTFGYAEDEPVLKDVSFSIRAGRVLGVLGRTGSGKTTMTRLLFRLYDVNSGDIRIGGADLKSLQLDHLRKHIGMVTQEVQLFHATIRDNLTFFDASISDERIMQVIGELGLQEWFAMLPDGLDTMLQASGTGLSAGESQLLAFTRVFLEDPGLVLLDEPSSRLDPATERLIARAVEQLLSTRTCIIIAHRMETIRRADEVLILDNGRIAEYGERAVLEADPDSRFSSLLRTGMEEELS